ncbi:MAG: methyltransferase [Prevotellaceae bacterium]|jgi:tRNA1Val (adenine37-N6)-methyltransferase|nr:methyltransferase [Prevotellaceae bacterium]
MPRDYFQFKQFTIRQSCCTMKVGTDGVLLGAWVNVDGGQAQRLLDVGCGTGLIAIMLAQRAPLAQVDAVEVEEMAYRQAMQNAVDSGWESRLRLFHGSFNELAQRSPVRYDLIVSNPPYFKQSLLSPNEKRNAARHANELTHEGLIGGSLRLLAEHGRLAVVLPYVEGCVFIALAASAGLYCARKLNVSTKRGKPVKRLLMELSRKKQPLDEQNLYIEDAPPNSYTSEYKALTKDFYLRF